MGGSAYGGCLVSSWTIPDIVSTAQKMGPDDRPFDVATQLMDHIPADEHRLDTVRMLHQLVLNGDPSADAAGELSDEALDFLACMVLVRTTGAELLDMTRTRLPQLTSVELAAITWLLKWPSEQRRSLTALTCRERVEMVHDVVPISRQRASDFEAELRVTPGLVRKTLRKIVSKDLERLSHEDLMLAALLLDMLDAERRRDPSFSDLH